MSLPYLEGLKLYYKAKEEKGKEKQWDLFLIDCQNFKEPVTFDKYLEDKIKKSEEEELNKKRTVGNYVTRTAVDKNKQFEEEMHKKAQKITNNLKRSKMRGNL